MKKLPFFVGGIYMTLWQLTTSSFGPHPDPGTSNVAWAAATVMFACFWACREEKP